MPKSVHFVRTRRTFSSPDTIWQQKLFQSSFHLRREVKLAILLDEKSSQSLWKLDIREAMTGSQGT